MKVVIVGGVAGGASCAARLRRLNENVEIVLLERGEYVSYANCGLPYYVGNVIKGQDSLLVMTPELMKARFNLDVRVRNEAVGVDLGQKKVRVKNLADGSTYEERYDYLVIATGASPVRPSIPGLDSPRIKTLWTVPDALAVRRMIEEEHARRAVVVGGGFIGLEAAENLRKQNVAVTLVQSGSQVMRPYDPEIAAILHDQLRQNGVALRLESGVKAFHEGGDGAALDVELKNGERVAADLVVLAIGARPNSQFVRDSGLALNARGSIVVSDAQLTSDPSVYAVGDVVEVADPIFGERAAIALAGPANKQGRIAADNIARRLDASEAFDPQTDAPVSRYSGTIGTSIVQLFDITAASTGANEKTLVSRGLVRGKDYETLLIYQNAHAGYYPGSRPMLIKLAFSLREGNRILGAQIVGFDGVDKRIDTISVAIQAGLSVVALKEFELAYAPPYSSAKDPVNMTGFVAENILRGLMRFAPYDVVEKDPDAVLLDVREDAERMAFEIPRAIPMPLGDLRAALAGNLLGDAASKLRDARARGARVVVFCASGVRAHTASRILSQNGFTNVDVYPGGVRFYQTTLPQPSEPESDASEPEQNQQSSPAPDAGDVQRVDCCGLQCPGPLMKVYSTVKDARPGQTFEVVANDPGFSRDIVSWCKRTGNELISNTRQGTEYVATLRKGGAAAVQNAASAASAHASPSLPQGKTIVVFSGDYDKVFASFVIANGALAMGRKVTMFFTFWGLAALRRTSGPRVKKTLMEKMFGAMLPRGTSKLKLSKMNMGGLGLTMMKGIMKKKNVDPLEKMVENALASGVKIVACSMSMDVMGIHKEELIDGVEIGGVGTYLGDAEESNTNLFI